MPDEPGPDGRYGGAFLFIRWTDAGDAPDGHLESEFLVWGADRVDAEARLKALDLHTVKAALDAAVKRGQELGDW